MIEFVSMINALAWPLAIVSLALLFRIEVKSMIARVGRVKYHDVEVTFRDDLRQAETLARSMPSKGQVVLEVEPESSSPKIGGEIIGDPKPVSPVQVELDRLASRSPREAVLKVWSLVGQALIKSASALGNRRCPAPTRADDAARYLIDRGWLTGPEALLVERLRKLHERVAQAEDAALTTDEARRFIELAFPMVARIETLG